MVASDVVGKPVRAFGTFYAMALDTFVVMLKPPFAWREFVLQSWFVARVSIVPTLMLTIPYTVLLTFTFNILLTEFGAADFSGTGAALARARAGLEADRLPGPALPVRGRRPPPQLRERSSVAPWGPSAGQPPRCASSTWRRSSG